MYKKVKQLAKLPIEYSHISMRRYDKKISVRFLKVLERERGKAELRLHEIIDLYVVSIYI